MLKLIRQEVGDRDVDFSEQFELTQKFISKVNLKFPPQEQVYYRKKVLSFFSFSKKHVSICHI
jgi:hypothetical protein